MTGQAGEGPQGPHRSARSRVIPEATVARLAVYLRVLTDRQLDPTVRSQRATHQIVSSAELAAAAGVNPAGLRRDLSFLGSHGVRGVGYDVGTLVEEIRRVLGAHHPFRVALIGIGNLGRALAGYAGFAGRGFEVAALFDVDGNKVGRSVGGLAVRHLDELREVCASESITIGLIATPEGAAQAAADSLVAAGIFSILNFAPGMVTVPEGVELRRVDLALELQMLAFYETSRASGVIGS